MDLPSLVAFLAFIINLEAAYIIYRLDPSSKANICFAVLCLVNALLDICYTFYFPAPSKERAAFWFHLSSVAWIPNTAVSLQFIITLVRKEKRLSVWVPMALFLPALVFTMMELLFHSFERDFIFSFGSWHAVMNDSSPVVWSFIAYMCIILTGAIYLLLGWKRVALTQLEKKQANIIISSLICVFPVIVIINVILPLFRIYYIPEVGVIMPVFFLAGILYAVTRFKLMMPGISNADLDGVSDLVIITDFRGNILKVNMVAESFLETTGREVVGKNISHLVAKPEQLIEDIGKFEREEHFSVPYDLNFRTKRGIIRPVTVSGSLVRDSLGRKFGCALIGRDTRKIGELPHEITRHLQAEESERRCAQKMLFIAKSAMSMNNLSPEEDFFSYLAQRIREQAGDCLVFVNSYYQDYQGMQIKALAGLPESILKFNKILGSTPVGIFYKMEEDRRLLYESGHMLELPLNLYEMWSGMIPEDICLEIENALFISGRYSLGLIKKGEFFGNIEILMRNSGVIENQLIVETLARMGTMAFICREMEKKEESFFRDIRFIRSGLKGISYAADRDAVFKALSTGLLDLITDSMVITIRPDDRDFEMMIDSINGNEKYINILYKILKKDLRGLRISPECKGTSDDLCFLGGGLSELTGGVISRGESEIVEKMLGLRNVYMMTMKKNNRLTGIISVMTRNAINSELCRVAEIFITQASLVL